VAWYGQLRPEKKPGIRTVGPLDIAALITPPMLGLYGEADLGIPVADVKEMEANLRQLTRRQSSCSIPGRRTLFSLTIGPVTGPMLPKTLGTAVWHGSTSTQRIDAAYNALKMEYAYNIMMLCVSNNGRRV